MKKVWLIWLLAVALLFTACSAAETATEPAAAENGESVQTTEETQEQVQRTQTLPTVLNTMEYSLYMNIFYNGTGGDYLGQTIMKEGTFATLYDSFNEVTRYYVWGYNDQTKCCDWQWEFVPKDPSQLPANGSFVKMVGVFSASEEALDGYWFTDAEVETEIIYDGPDCDVDLGTMSATLERVQIINMQVFPANYEGMQVRIYGRVAGVDSIEHPYYDGAWTQSFTSDDEIPAIGKVVTVTGTWSNGTVTEAVVALTDTY